MAVRGGLTRFARRYSAHPWASPLRGQRRRCSKTLPAFLSGQPAYCVRGLSNWLRQLSNPGRGFSSPPVENIKEKSPYSRTGSHLEYGGEGGIDSLRSPLRGSPLTACAVCPTGCASCRTPVGGSHPPPVENIKEKSPYSRTGSHLEYGGEGGIRTPDTLPYTHFPGVLLQPLGHLTILSFPLLSGTGANVGKYVSPVNQLFAKKARLDKLRATCSLNVRNPFFLSPVAFPFSLGGNLLCWQTNRKQ